MQLNNFRTPYMLNNVNAPMSYINRACDDHIGVITDKDALSAFKPINVLYRRNHR